ncbi:MAG: hypothetical protein GWO08_01730, partial [Gammaproteobacteria bacterium]|nr:hypothetical protein [Gammaproteobacteria bacterium]NIW46322.1 hypothetical protein [Gammaproteobacteria bacterium]
MSDKENPSLERRGFLQVAVASTATALVIIFNRNRIGQASGPAGEGEYSWAMVIDQTK